MKSWLEKNNIVTYSTHNEEKSVVAETFTRTLKNKIYKYMTSSSKIVYIDKLDNNVNKYINKYDSTIKTKPVDVKPSTYIESCKEINYQDPKFKFGDIVWISKYKNIFAKGYVSNWSEEVFLIKQIKNTVPWIYVISDLKSEEIVATFYKKELQKKKKKKKNQKEFRV